MASKAERIQMCGLWMVCHHLFGSTAIIIILLLVTGCWQKSDDNATDFVSRSDDYCPLPDPAIMRLGKMRAQELQITGAKDHISKLPEYYPGCVDVIGQGMVAMVLLENPRLYAMQRPIILFAGIRQFPIGRCIHVDAVNTNRETIGFTFWFTIKNKIYCVTYDVSLAEKDEELIIAKLFDFRYCDAIEIERMVSSVQHGVRHIVLYEKECLASDDCWIPLPKDSAVFVSITDNNRTISDMRYVYPYNECIKLGIHNEFK